MRDRDFKKQPYASVETGKIVKVQGVPKVEIIQIYIRKTFFQLKGMWFWCLHTRACEYNLSALVTYFECEGVKYTHLVTKETLVVQRSRSAPPQAWSTPHLRTHLNDQ